MKKFLQVLLMFQLAFVVAVSGAQAQSIDDAGEYSQAELDQILAPIALYPDSVLSHLLIASTYPLEVVMADRWARQNSKLKGDKAINAVDEKDWDASIKALVAFPTVLERMSSDLDWTESVGEAFLADEERVLKTIQNLRQRAYDEGNLNSLEHMRVTKEDDDIVIEPIRREVVYIPVYNTRIVYGPWWWNNYPPVYWHHDDFYHRQNRLVYWGPSVYISHSFFFGAFHWHNHHVVVLDRPYRRVYRDNYYSNRYIVRNEHSHRWTHNQRNRRGVEYKNPRTRDHFENRDREQRNGTTSNRRRENDRNNDRQYRGERDQRRSTVERSPARVEERLRRSDRRDENGSARVIKGTNFNAKRNESQRFENSQRNERAVKDGERASARSAPQKDSRAERRTEKKDDSRAEQQVDSNAASRTERRTERSAQSRTENRNENKASGERNSDRASSRARSERSSSRERSRREERVR